MNPRVRVGLLPLYIKLYDDVLPKLVGEFEPFMNRVADGLAGHGVEVVRAPVCRLAGQFAQAVASLEAADVDLLACLHLAYSPSLESVESLARCRPPLLLLDTTMDHDFGLAVDPKRLLYNHGVHGVQDLACILRRVGRPFEIVAGHVSESEVLARAADIARAACAARRFRGAKVLRIGPVFAGMGDFAVDDRVLQQALGVSVQQIQPADLASAVGQVTDAMIAEELALDRERYEVRADPAVHRRSVRLGLGLRRFLESGRFDAFSMNFLAFDAAAGPVDTVPFLEISKAMARGVGYAGEGDALTASLVGALLAGFERTTFTEIFCPDWKGNSLFLSHMGELNPAVAAARPILLEKDFPYTRASNPAYLAAAVAPGAAVFVNLAPGPDDSFRLIAAPVETLGDGSHPDMARTVRGWMRTPIPVARWLEEFSRLGGTHHSALVLGTTIEAIAAFARFADIEFSQIR